MSSLKLFRTASRVNKIRYAFTLQVDVQSLRLHPLHKEKDVTITLSKAGGTGSKSTTTPSPRKPGAPWNDTLTLVASLYRDKHGRYQEKKYVLTVKQAGTAKTLATFQFDASHFASAAGTKETCELRSVNAKDDGLLKVEIACIFLRQVQGLGSEASSMISSAVGDENDEQDLSGFDGSGGGGGSDGVLPESVSSSHMPAPMLGALAGMASQPRMSFKSLRPPPHPPQQPSSPAGSVVGEAELDEAIKAKQSAQKRVAQLEEAYATLLAKKKAAEEETQALRTAQQSEQQQHRKLTGEQEQAVQILRQRATELELQVADRDTELARVHEVLKTKEVALETAQQTEARLVEEAKEAQEHVEELRRLREEREAEVREAEEAAAEEMNRLQSELGRLKDSLAAVNDDAAAVQLGKKLESVEKEKQALQESLEEMETSLAKTRARRDQVEEERGALALRVAEMNDEAERLRGQQAEADAVRARVHALETELRAALARATATEASLLAAQPDDKAKLVADLEERAVQWESEKESLVARVEEMKATLAQARTEAEALAQEAGAEKASLTARVQELQAAVEEGKTKAETYRQRLAASGASEAEEATQWAQEKASMTARIQELEMDLEETKDALLAEQQREATEEDIATAQWATEKGSLVARVSELESALATAQSVLEEATTALSQANEDGEQEKAGLLARVQEMEASLTTAKSNEGEEAARALDAKAGLARRVQELEADKAGLAAELIEQQQRLAAQGGAEGKAHKEEAEKWAKEKTTLIARVQGLESDLQAVTAKVGKDKERLAAQLEEIAQLVEIETEKEALAARCRDLEEALRTAEEAARTAEEEASDAWRTLAQTKEDLEAHDGQERELERSLQLLQTQLIHGDRDLGAARAAREKAERQAMALEERLQEVEEETAALAEERDTYQGLLVETKLEVAQLREQVDSLNFHLQHLRVASEEGKSSK